MSKFKVGDEVVLLEPSKIELKKGFKKGQVFKVCEILGDDIVIVNSIHGLYFNQIDFNKYHYSNRSKLREHIKSLGFSAIDLSVAAGFNKAYFGSETGESRFNSRGDISDDRLLELKHKAFEAKKKLAVDELISESIEKINNITKIKKPKSKWIVSNKVFFTFVFFFVLLILLAVTGIVKQVF